MDTRNPRKITSASPAFWKQIGYSYGGREWAPGNLINWTKYNSGSCCFTSVSGNGFEIASATENQESRPGRIESENRTGVEHECMTTINIKIVIGIGMRSSTEIRIAIRTGIEAHAEVDATPSPTSAPPAGPSPVECECVASFPNLNYEPVHDLNPHNSPERRPFAVSNETPSDV
ncbi:hypothetical protein EVAR_92398_1 [Eumeta japonica]|uniref:Uncharacterized protein n=1 Tax=Eumeta variegata TaxID=151549 RepID=A0A4C1TIS8_EUMVA|nr:hypothetical protein EVAR_92398_1 [Eumeta japonica]